MGTHFCVTSWVLVLGFCICSHRIPILFSPGLWIIRPHKIQFCTPKPSKSRRGSMSCFFCGSEYTLNLEVALNLSKNNSMLGAEQHSLLAVVHLSKDECLQWKKYKKVTVVCYLSMMFHCLHLHIICKGLNLYWRLNYEKNRYILHMKISTSRVIGIIFVGNETDHPCKICMFLSRCGNSM